MLISVLYPRLTQDKAPLEFMVYVVVLELWVALPLKLVSAPCPEMVTLEEVAKP